MKIAIVCALKDQASKTIFEELKKLGLPSWATTYIFDCNTIDVPLEEVNEDEIIVLSKHSSKAGNKSLTVHHLGNYNTADFGGEPKTLVNSMPKITTNLLRGLNENNSNEGYINFT